MAKLVQLSEAASLAVHAMVLIAKAPGHINVNQIADKMGASRNHLAKVLQQLVKYDYLRSVRGPSGGFILNKKAADITLLDIYEAIEGKIEITGCPLDRQVCPFNKCLMSGMVNEVTIQLKSYLKSQNLDEFVNNPEY